MQSIHKTFNKRLNSLELRLEPTWMHLGEVAGMAAEFAISKNANVQDIDIPELQAKIAKAGIPLEWSVADKNTELKQLPHK